MRSSYSRRPTTEEVTFSGPFLQTIGGEPKVYWSKRHRVFFGKYKLHGCWKNKVVPVCIDTEEKATKWFTLWLEKLEADHVEPINDMIVVDERKTIRNLGDRWLTWKKQSCTTELKPHRDAGRLLRKWVYPHPIADIDLENELELGICTDWVEWVKKAGRAPYTTRNIVQGLRGFLVDVRGKGWAKLRENPLLDPYIRKVLGTADTIAGKNTIIHLKKDEAQRLLLNDSELIAPIRKVRNLLAIATGARAGEIGALRWEDLDLEARVPTATIFRQVQFTGLKGSPIFKDPKRRSHRILPLHPTSAAALRWWKEKGWKEYVGINPNPSDPVFPTPHGEYTMARWSPLLKADLAIAGIPVLFDGKHPITFHALRRTFMSLLDGENVARDLISVLAGHSGKSVADRHYIAKNIDRFYNVILQLPIPERLPWIPESGPEPTV
jgi:integrase